jgi:AAA+ superfamily predicted ATPase
MIEIVKNQTDSSFKSIFSYLEQIIKQRLAYELKKELPPVLAIQLEANKSYLSHFIIKNKLSNQELIFLLLAIVPHLAPNFITGIISEYLPNGGEFPEFGGIKGKNHRGILPTAETAIFVIYGHDFDKRIEGMEQITEKSILFKNQILRIEEVPAGEPPWSGKLLIDVEYLAKLTTGTVVNPKLSSEFPAQLITTGLEWSDLVLQEKTIFEINEIETWLKYNEKLMNDWKMRGKIKPGFRILFHGPAGTGKTMTACLLGKFTKRDVFRIDLSMVVSKYIGETEKNLSKLFDKAANKDWILFFDEADSVFGKRTNVRDAHDKYANQEVSYLLQRIEAHAGLIILASNMKTNIDPSFTRRFNSIIEFENPGLTERLQLWKNYIPSSIKTDKRISLKEIARKYDLTGANIVNVIQYAGLKTIEKDTNVIEYEDLLKGIQKEYLKEGKMMRME